MCADDWLKASTSMYKHSATNALKLSTLNSSIPCSIRNFTISLGRWGTGTLGSCTGKCSHSLTANARLSRNHTCKANSCCLIQGIIRSITFDYHRNSFSSLFCSAEHTWLIRGLHASLCLKHKTCKPRQAYALSISKLMP